MATFMKLPFQIKESSLQCLILIDKYVWQLYPISALPINEQVLESIKNLGSSLRIHICTIHTDGQTNTAKST